MEGNRAVETVPRHFVSASRPRSSVAVPTVRLCCVTQMAQAVGDQNPRFKSENILALELDMPERTTYDYGGPMMDDRVRVSIFILFILRRLPRFRCCFLMSKTLREQCEDMTC